MKRGSTYKVIAAVFTVSILSVVALMSYLYVKDREIFRMAVIGFVALVVPIVVFDQTLAFMKEFFGEEKNKDGND